MALTTLRHKARDLFFISPEPLSRTIHQPASIDAPNVIGTVSGTTISASSAAVASHAAKLCRVVAPDSARGQARLTTAASAGVSVTLQSAFSTSGSTQWEFWVLPSVLRATGGTATTATCAPASNPGISQTDDYYNGLYLFDLTDQDLVAITDYTGATGAFANAALGEAPTAGDAFMVLSPCFAPWTITAEQAPIAQPAATGDLTHRTFAAGVKRGTATGSVPARGVSTAGSDGVVAVQDYELGTILRSQMNQHLNTGELISGGASTGTSLNVTDGTAVSQFTVGNLVLWNGGVACITAIDGTTSPDTITVSPTVLRGGAGYTPASGETLFGMACWQRDMDVEDMSTLTVVQWMGSETLRLLQGCAWNAILKFEPNAVPRFDFTMTGAALIEYDATTSIKPTLSTKVARNTRPIVIMLDTTEQTHVISAEVDFGFSPQRADAVSAYDGTAEVFVTKGQPRITWKQWVQSYTGAEDVQRARIASVLIQSGKNAGNVVACYAHRVEYTGAVVSEENGGYVLTFTGDVLGSLVTDVPDLVYGQG